MAGTLCRGARHFLRASRAPYSNQGHRYLFFKFPAVPGFHHFMDRAVGHCFWTPAVVRRLFFAHEEPPVLGRSRLVTSEPQASVSSSCRARGSRSGAGRAHPLPGWNHVRQRRTISGEPIYFPPGNHNEMVNIFQSKRRHLFNWALHCPDPHDYQSAEQPTDALSCKSTLLVEAAFLFARRSLMVDWIVAGLEACQIRRRSAIKGASYQRNRAEPAPVGPASYAVLRSLYVPTRRCYPNRTRVADAERRLFKEGSFDSVGKYHSLFPFFISSQFQRGTAPSAGVHLTWFFCRNAHIHQHDFCWLREIRRETNFCRDRFVGPAENVLSFSRMDRNFKSPSF